MTTSYVSSMVRAVWAVLKAEGSDTAAFMAENNGHYYEEDTGSKKPEKITKSDCPAICMWPGAGGITIKPATNKSFDVRVPLNFELHVEEESVDAALDFYVTVLADLQAAWIASWFGLTGSGRPHLIEFGMAQVTKTYDEKTEVAVTWRVAFSVTAVFRRDIS